MAFRERPYSQFNFTVGIDGLGEPKSIKAGFQEVSGLGLEITVAEYRNGNEGVNAVRKITGTHKVPDVTCKRGVIGDNTLYNWLKEIRDGKQDSLKSMTISLLSEDRATVAQSWRLTNARPIKYTGPQLSGKGTDVAVEEVVFAAEGIEQEF